MGPLKRKVLALERAASRALVTPGTLGQEAISHAVLRCLSDDELAVYEAAIERVIEGEEPTQVARVILHHVESLYEEAGLGESWF